IRLCEAQVRRSEMPGTPSSGWLLTGLILFTEYFVQHWWEGLPAMRWGMSVRQYAFYRALHVAVLSVLLCAVFVPDARTVYVVLLLTFLALLELPLAWFETAAHARWSLRLRWLQLIPTALLVVAGVLANPEFQARPWVGQLLVGSPWLGGGDFAAAASVIAAYALLAHPANHVIRVLRDKEADRLVPEMGVGRGRGTRSIDVARLASEATPPAEAAPALEAAAAAEAAPAGAQAGPDPDWQTLRAGRVIGALER